MSEEELYSFPNIMNDDSDPDYDEEEEDYPSPQKKVRRKAKPSKVKTFQRRQFRDPSKIRLIACGFQTSFRLVDVQAGAISRESLGVYKSNDEWDLLAKKYCDFTTELRHPTSYGRDVSLQSINLQGFEDQRSPEFLKMKWKELRKSYEKVKVNFSLSGANESFYSFSNSTPLSLWHYYMEEGRGAGGREVEEGFEDGNAPLEQKVSSSSSSQSSEKQINYKFICYYIFTKPRIEQQTTNWQ